MPAKKSKSPKSSGAKKPAKSVKKPAKAAKPVKKSLSKSKPTPAAKAKKPVPPVKKKSAKPAPTKKAQTKPAKAAKPAKTAAKPAKAPKTEEKKKPAPPPPAPVAEAPRSSKKKETAASQKVIAPPGKPLHFAPLKPTPRHKPEEQGATIEVAKGPVKWTPFMKKQKQRLVELRDSMLNMIEGVSQESLRQRAEGGEASAFGMHQADAGSDAYDRDFALSLLSQEQDALNEINEALTRIENGTYGICEMSGRRIPEVRLEALPFTRFTVECQEQIERQQMGGRGRMPVRSLFGLDEAADEAGDDGDEEESTTSNNRNSESLDFAKE